MKSSILKAIAIIFFLFVFATPIAYSYTYTFTPTPQDLSELDHGRFYEWGIRWTKPAGDTGIITSATLSFIDIRDWQSEEDYLYTSLLNIVNDDNNGYSPNYANKTTGTTASAYQSITKTYTDNDMTNAFPRLSGQEYVWLGTWSDPEPQGSSHTHLVSYTITDPVYLGWLSDGNFGFGIDPDCHYYNSRIELTITTTPSVPEPTTLLLLGLSLAGVAGIRRKMK